MQSKRGFTLVELLVAVSIIALLTTIGMIVYSSVQIKARDARRKSDLQSLRLALELYYQKNGQYPFDKNTGYWNNSSQPQPWIAQLVPDYMNTLPLDPKANEGIPTQALFGYGYWSGDTTGYNQGNIQTCPGTPGQYFVLVTKLENTGDPDRNAVKDYKWCNGKGLYNDYHWSGDDYIITSRD